MTSRRVGWLVALVACACMGGCLPRHWEVVRGPGPEAAADAAREYRVRIELLSGELKILYRPHVEGDSVVGIDAMQDVGRRRVAYALQEVRTAERSVRIKPVDKDRVLPVLLGGFLLLMLVTVITTAP